MNFEPRIEHGLDTDFFRAGGRPSSAVALLRRVEASSRAPASGKLADRGGNSALSARRGGCRSSRAAIAVLLLLFPPIPAPTAATARVRNQECAAEQAHPWRRTVRQWQPLLPLLGERAGVRAEFSNSLPHSRLPLLSVFLPCPTRPPSRGLVRGQKPMSLSIDLRDRATPASNVRPLKD